jgi:hypothetical protein
LIVRFLVARQSSCKRPNIAHIRGIVARPRPVATPRVRWAGVGASLCTK